MVILDERFFAEFTLREANGLKSIELQAIFWWEGAFSQIAIVKNERRSIVGKKRVSTMVLSALLIFSICFVCFPISKALAKDLITAGFSMALTGIYSPMAVGQMGSYQLWEEVVNQQGGIYVKEYGKKLPVKLVYYDDKSQAETAVKIYEKLITDDKVDVLLSPQSTTIHFAIAPLAEKYKVPIVGSTAASVKLREVSNRYFWFITACVPDRQMKALVDLLKSLGVKKVAVIYLQDLFPRENLQFLQPELKKAGIQTVVTKDYPPGVKDLTTLLTEVKGKNPEAVIALCYPADAFLITTQAQEVGLDPKLLFELVGPLIDVFAPKFGGLVKGFQRWVIGARKGDGLEPRNFTTGMSPSLTRSLISWIRL